MSKADQWADQVGSKHRSRYGRQAQTEAEARHLLYLGVRGHLKAGWVQLPDGLTQRNLRELATMAKARGDRLIYALCQGEAAKGAN
jgi:hypothetical protein